MITGIVNGRVITENGIINCNVYFDGTIVSVTDKALPCDLTYNANGNYVSPGFIDIHVHGGGGYDFMDGGTEAIVKAAQMHLEHGTTTIIPTTLACSTKTLLEFFADLRKVINEGLCKSNIPGAHLEGPYFSLAQCGAQNPDYIVKPASNEYNEIYNAGMDIILRWSFAPELDGGVEFCEFLKSKNIVSSVAHSDGVYEDVQKAYSNGCRLITHLYSGMSTITRHGGFRKLGVIESAYLFDDMAVELIADGCHLPPELLKLVVKHKGVDNICLVTDAMRGAGMPDGKTLLGRITEATECIIEDGVCKMPDRSGFAGSVATADRLIRTMVKKAGVSVFDAVKMMTSNPARVMHFTDCGSITEGNRADIVIFDNDINIKKVYVSGKEA